MVAIAITSPGLPSPSTAGLWVDFGRQEIPRKCAGLGHGCPEARGAIFPGKGASVGRRAALRPAAPEAHDFHSIRLSPDGKGRGRSGIRPAIQPGHVLMYLGLLTQVGTVLLLVVLFVLLEAPRRPAPLFLHLDQRMGAAPGCTADAGAALHDPAPRLRYAHRDCGDNPRLLLHISVRQAGLPHPVAAWHPPIRGRPRRSTPGLPAAPVDVRGRRRVHLGRPVRRSGGGAVLAGFRQRTGVRLVQPCARQAQAAAAPQLWVHASPVSCSS